MASRSLATYVFPLFLGRLSILPAMSVSRYFCMSFIHRYGIVCRRGSLFPPLRRSLCIDINQTLTSRFSEKLQFARANSDTSEGEGVDSQDPDIIPDELADQPLPLRAVLTKPVIISLTNFAMLTLLNGVLESYFLLVWSTPVE